MAITLNIRNLPTTVKTVIAFLPAIVISAVVIVFLFIPKNSEIKKLKAEISSQENEIAKNQVKASKLAVLKAENEKLKTRLAVLKEQLPEEKEVSGLLRQISDLGIRSGLNIISWRPEQKKNHTSGVVYEIPVAVELSGSYHNLGYFFSNLTKLNRIVNISDIWLGDPKAQKNEAILRISFKATTFSAISE